MQQPALRIRTSGRSTFKRCPQRWYWSYVDGLEPIGLPNRNLWFGTGIHLCLSEWYGLGTSRLVHPLETWEKYTAGTMRQMRVYFDNGNGIESEWVDAIELGRAILTAYLEEYGEDEQWDFIATEKSGQVKIRVPVGSGWVVYYYTYDGVYRDLADGLTKLLETKTAASISTGHLTLDDQAGSYWATANVELRRSGVLGPKELIGGITYNFLRKGMPDSRPRHPVTGERCNKPTKEHYLLALEEAGQFQFSMKNKLSELVEAATTNSISVFGDVSATQPSPLFLRHFVERTTKERNNQIRRIQDEAVHMYMVQHGSLPVIKTPMGSGASACQYGCEYFLMCELHEAGQQWEVYRDAMFKKRDPFAEYKKSTGEE